MAGSWYLFAASGIAALLVTGRALAQTVTTAPMPPAIAEDPGQPAPARYVGGVSQSPRPANLDPTGVNYSDCIEDMTLEFTVLASGFSAQNIQVWATAGDSCADPSARGAGGAGGTCWLVNPGIAALVQPPTSPQPYRFNVRVQDLVGPQNGPPAGSAPVSEGVSACEAQVSFVGVPLTIWFLPLDPSGNLAGTPYSYSLLSDLVGPPTPVGVTVSAADGDFVIGWVPNVDDDTAGYDVYVESIPGSASSGSIADAGLSACPAAALETTLPPEGGSATLVVDDAGDGDASRLVTVVGGGTSTIPASYLVGADGGASVTGEATRTYRITGLTNGSLDAVVVSAVDGSGNIGPPSGQVCGRAVGARDAPASGSSCALDPGREPAPLPIVFAGFAAAALTLERRRRVRR
jgi:hypothetical protein